MHAWLHDSLLVAYAVSSEPPELVLSLLPHHGTASGPFSLVFRDVAAHCFPSPLLPGVVHGVVPVSVEAILNDEWASIQRGYKKCGWPGPWAESLESALAFATAKKLQAFRVESCYGLEGWVIAA